MPTDPTCNQNGAVTGLSIAFTFSIMCNVIMCYNLMKHGRWKRVLRRVMFWKNQEYIISSAEVEKDCDSESRQTITTDVNVAWTSASRSTINTISHESNTNGSESERISHGGTQSERRMSCERQSTRSSETSRESPCHVQGVGSCVINIPEPTQQITNENFAQQLHENSWHCPDNDGSCKNDVPGQLQQTFYESYVMKTGEQRTDKSRQRPRQILSDSCYVVNMPGQRQQRRYKSYEKNPENRHGRKICSRCSSRGLVYENCDSHLQGPTQQIRNEDYVTNVDEQRLHLKLSLSNLPWNYPCSEGDVSDTSCSTTITSSGSECCEICDCILCIARSDCSCEFTSLSSLTPSLSLISSSDSVFIQDLDNFDDSPFIHKPVVRRKSI